MREFGDLGKEELRDTLVTNWMTHDAMWFAHVVRHCGIEQTNALNRAAVEAMAELEVRRLRTLLELTEIESFPALRRFVEQAFEVVRAPFMTFALTFPEHNVMRWDVPRCFAHDGVTRLGVADQYQCAIFLRFDTWLRALGVRFTATPDVAGCLLHAGGPCAREYRFAFDR